jgi:DNA-binding IclR family transcriptional regulator
MIQVLEKSIRILDVLATHERLPLRELAAKTGLHKNTLFNIVKTLADLGILTQKENSDYALGKKIPALALPYYRKNTVAGMAQRYAEEIAAVTGESAVVSLWHSRKVLVLGRQISSHSVVVRTAVEGNLDIISTASGKVILANLENSERNLMLGSIDLCNTPFSDRVSLDNHLSEIREQGWAVTDVPDKQALGIAVPVKGDDFLAALGLNIPLFRYSQESRDAFLSSLFNLSQKMKEEVSLYFSKI